jgi:hypothetical protein
MACVIPAMSAASFYRRWFVNIREIADTNAPCGLVLADKVMAVTSPPVTASGQCRNGHNTGPPPGVSRNEHVGAIRDRVKTIPCRKSELLV